MTTYFQWNGDFYEQLDGVAMRNPLSPVVANFFIEKFEQDLQTAVKKPAYWFRYVGNTFVIQNQGQHALKDIPTHLNIINPKI